VIILKPKVKRHTKNDRTITLSDAALDVYNTWGHKKSEKVSESIIEKHKQESGILSVEEQIKELRTRIERLEGEK
jgi:hypothetical protein